MKHIKIELHVAGSEHAKALEMAEDATIEQLLKEIHAAGAAVGESGDEIVLLVENQEVSCRKYHKLHECGIRHGHKLHFHAREVTIIVNTREKKWNKHRITYEDVVVLAFGSYSTDPNVVYTVTYSKGPEHHREGSLVKGKSIEVKQGMIFNVTQTNKS